MSTGLCEKQQLTTLKAELNFPFDFFLTLIDITDLRPILSVNKCGDITETHG